VKSSFSASNDIRLSHVVDVWEIFEAYLFELLHIVLGHIFLLRCAVETSEIRDEQLMKIKIETLARYVYYSPLGRLLTHRQNRSRV